MRIGGQQAKRIGVGRVRLHQPDGNSIELKVQAFPLGFDVDEKFPWPQAPKIKARRTSGSLERDDAGRVVWDLDDRNAEYRKARERTDRVRKACQVAMALVHGDGEGEVRFETDVASGAEAAYLALWDELQASGFTEGDLVVIVYRAKEISNMTDKALEASLSDFSQAANSPKDSAEAEQ